MNFSATQVSFNKAELRALLAHASTDLTRAALASIFFNAAQCAAVATDGHRIAVCEADGEKASWDYLVPRECAETALRVTKGETFILTPASADIGVFDKANRRIATIPATQPTGATFPPYQQIMREPSARGVAQGINVDYLASAKLIADAVPAATRGAVFHPGPDAQDPVILKIHTWTLLIMPRTDTEKHAGKSRIARDVLADAAALATVSSGIVTAAPQVPSAAITLAERVTAPLATLAPQKGKRGPAIVLHTTPVNAVTLGSDAPLALPPKKSREREWREAHATVADTPADKLRAWVKDAAPIDAPPRSAPPWG